MVSRSSDAGGGASDAATWGFFVRSPLPSLIPENDGPSLSTLRAGRLGLAKGRRRLDLVEHGTYEEDAGARLERRKEFRAHGVTSRTGRRDR